MGPAPRSLLLANLMPLPGGRAALGAVRLGRQGTAGLTSPTRWKEKRLLQAVALVLAALVFLHTWGSRCCTVSGSPMAPLGDLE